jgi:hypothetical protein
MVIMNDRPQGGTSMTNGSIELMMNRRMLVRDGYGIGETLNEYDNPFSNIAYDTGIKTRFTFY